MWDVFSIPDPQNKGNTWELFLHQSRFTLDHMKHHVKILQKGLKSDKYMVQNLTWLGVYLRSTFSYDLLHKVLKLVQLTATVPEVYVSTMTTVLSDSYDSLAETLNHTKNLKIKDNPGDNVADCCDTILVDVDHLEIARVFNHEHLIYITRILKDTSDYRFRLWATQKYKQVMEFIKRLCVCEKYVMKIDDIITYGHLVQEAIREYCNIFYSKRGEPTDNNNIS